jgi:hypothetical protein
MKHILYLLAFIPFALVAQNVSKPVNNNSDRRYMTGLPSFVEVHIYSVNTIDKKEGWREGWLKASRYYYREETGVEDEGIIFLFSPKSKKIFKIYYDSFNEINGKLNLRFTKLLDNKFEKCKYFEFQLMSFDENPIFKLISQSIHNCAG